MRTDKIKRLYMSGHDLPAPIADALIAAGYLTAKAIRKASDTDLLSVYGINELTLKEIRQKTALRE